MHYSYKYKKSNSFFWRTVKNLIGHKVVENKMIFFHLDGSQTIIAVWDKYDAKLGTDWFLFVKKDMEKETGVDLKLK